MVDSVGSSAGYLSPQRSGASLPASRLRSAEVLTAIQQSGSSGTGAAVRVFSVSQASRAESSAMAKLPRGSLIDVLV